MLLATSIFSTSILYHLRIGDFQYVAFLAISFLIAISVHESAHAWMAYRLGDSTAKDEGRISLNPLVHLDVLGTLLLLFIGLGYAKPVPYNPYNFNEGYGIKKGSFWVAIAGPLSNFILAFFSYFSITLFNLVLINTTYMGLGYSFSSYLFSNLIYFLYIFFNLNIGLLVFNLLPLPPLDGSKIWGVFLPDGIYQQLLASSRIMMGVFFALILILPSFFDNLLDTLATPFISIIIYPLNYLFNLVLFFFS